MTVATSSQPQAVSALTAPSPKAKTIAPLTSLRFIAAALIVIYHCGPVFIPSLSNILNRLELAQGVSFFFLLSGFILSYVTVSLSSFQEHARFWTRRIVRLWPLHLLIFAAMLLIFPTGDLVGAGVPRTPVLLANAFMVHAWFLSPSCYFSVNSPSWSISVELLFYIAFPLLLAWGRKFAWLPVAVTGLLAGAFILIGNVFSVQLSASGISAHSLIYINPLVRILEFAIGMTIANLVRSSVHTKDADRIGRTNPSGQQPDYWACTAWEFGALILTIFLMAYTHPITQTLKNTFSLGEAGGEWLQYAGVSLLGFVSLIAVLSREQGWLSTFLSHPVFVLLGEISFATYLLHIPLVLCRSKFFPHVSGVGGFVAFLCVLYVLSFLAYLLDGVVRKPVLKATDKLLAKYSGSS